MDLVSSAAWTAAGRDPRALRRGGAAGDRVRVRHGVYADSADWAAADAPSRQLMRIRAVHERARSAPVFSHESAAELLGLPRIGAPSTAVHLAVAGPMGRREGIVRHVVALADDDVVSVGGLRCTSPARTMLDLAATRTFADAVVAADASLHRGVAVDDVLALLSLAPRMRGCSRALAVIRFAVPTAWPIESASRANMHLLRLPAPELQRRFSDDDGLIGAADFWWPHVRGIGECDGRIKYLDARFRGGRSAEQVVYDEKIREDRLRAVSSGFARWGWAVAVSPQLLGARLARIGVTR